MHNILLVLRMSLQQGKEKQIAGQALGKGQNHKRSNNYSHPPRVSRLDQSGGSSLLTNNWHAAVALKKYFWYTKSHALCSA